MIEINGLTKRYGDKTAVDGLSFVVEPGVVTGFLGPNGAGKSTTMRMIAGLDRPDSGTVRVNGKNYPQAPAPMAELGILLDARSVHPGLSAGNNLLALARTACISRRRVDEVIELAGLAEVAGTGPADSPSAWASASAWPRRCSASPRPSCWTSRSTAWTQTAFAGSGCCSSHWPPKAARFSFPRT